MVQKSRETSRTTEDQEVDERELAAAQQAGKTALEGVNDEDIDKMLAEIDNVLEDDAQTFVDSFIQKGGE